MSDLAIRVENLSKRYRIGARQTRHDTLRDALTAKFKGATGDRRPETGTGLPSPVSGLASPASGQSDLIWALKDVSFEVKRGEVVGIIGRNGAGKSTLLKILSRITKPTTGYADLYGRVASLLEIGTGFHQELTGRENIYLSGAILGMRKAEIDRKFDEIVAFSEIDKFIDTPVKRYSSGMYVRLAFAVAAHLEPEILLVDEVLAVGDAAFQKKCLGKMGDVAREGRTVLFVSHNMAAVTRLCPRVILLDNGKILRDGQSHQVVSAYLSSGYSATAVREWADLSKAPGDDVVRLCAVRVRAENGETTTVTDIRKPVGIEIEYQVLKPDNVLVPNLHFYNEEGIYAFVLIERDGDWYRRPRSVGRFKSTVWIPGNFLSEGSLVVGVAITTFTPFHIHFYERDAIAFQVVDSLDGNSARGDYAGHMPGVVRPVFEWKTQFVPESTDKLSQV